MYVRAVGIAGAGLMLLVVSVAGMAGVGLLASLPSGAVTPPVLAQSYGQQGYGQQSRAGAAALDWAQAQVGTPYVWGGETPGVGFDCSGLVQAAYRVAGVGLPRVAQDQYDAGPDLPAGAALEPGDLVFFGGGPGDVSHVGIYAGIEGGQTVMVDAPHTGADVRVEPFPTTVGASFGAGDVYLGATRPGP